MQVSRQVVWATPEGEYEVDLVAAGDATVGDLRVALTGGAPGDLSVGGATAPADHGLDEAGLHVGAVVRLPSAAAPPTAPPVAEVRVVGGLDAGHVVPLPPGTVVLGRGPDADLDLGSGTVSRRHASVDVGLAGTARLTDLDTTNGTAVDGTAVAGGAGVGGAGVGPVDVAAGAVVELGSVQITVAPPVEPDRPLGLDARRDTGPTGTLAFNRPPRTALPAPGSPLTAPVPPRESDRPPFSLVALVAPLAMAGVLVSVTGAWQFALFALLSPVMVLGNHYEARRRSRRSLKRDTRSYQGELAEFRAELEARRAAEAATLRAATPDLAETLRRAEGPSVRLWERRPGMADFLRLSAGLADTPWTPPLTDLRTAPSGGTADALAEASTLPAVPVLVDLAEGGVVGVVGHRDAALALARALLCQATVQTGPADLRVAVLVDADRAAEWDWAKWLPHTRDPAGATDARLLAAGTDACASLLRDLIGGADTSEDRAAPRRDDRTGPVLLAVIDADRLLDGRAAPGRALLRGVAGPVAGIVIAEAPDRLPAVCTTVVECTDEDGYAVLRRPQRGEVVEDVPLAGLAEPTARRCARALARFEDPEVVSADAGLPDRVDLLPLLDLPALDAPSVRARWTGSSALPRPTAVIGVGERGPFSLDLLADGPHGLVGGTTGSGKSELLRTVVTSLAVGSSPEDLTFVLVDYKGGSAFDECARLPHTVGLVTDLDEQLGERALRCLEAELKHRERRLRDAGVGDLVEWQALRLRDPGRAGEPLPRLAVVIDEFATLATELPDFLTALVGVAQRGRSLGVHLLLATQRPSGAVNENIKANTNLRIALRVQSGPDSTDVIGTQDAARISRGRAGRAYVRLGADEVVPIQTALVTGVTRSAGGTSVDAAPFVLGPRARSAGPVGAPPPAGLPPERTDLDRLVEVIGEAFSGLRRPLPRQPWPAPLPTTVDLATVLPPSDDGLVPFALADDPEAQSQYPTGWRPGEGNLLLYGVGGSGTTTALGSLAVALARTRTPDQLHLYVLDMGGGELAPLADLPHCGAVVGATERERQLRLVRLLRSELDRRKDLGPTERSREPAVVLLLDGLPGFWSEYSDALGLEVTEELSRVYADGPEVGISVVATADRGGGVPGRLAAVTTQKWLFRLPDAVDYGAFGIRSAQVPAAAPGRAVVASSAQVLQVALPGVTLAAAVAAVLAAAPPVGRRPRRVEVLPSTVRASSLTAHVRVPADGPWSLPFGVLDRDSGPAALTLYDGEHGLVAGPARSGRSTVLAVIAEGAAAAGVRVAAVALRPSPLRTCPAVVELATTPVDAAALVRSLSGREQPVLLLVDDAEAYDDPEGAVAALLAARAPALHLVAAARADGLRSLFGHWTQTVRRGRSGVLLRPDVDLDGELLGVRLPRRERVPVRVGRGYLCTGGDVELVQGGEPDVGPSGG